MIMSSTTACSTPSVHAPRSVLLAKHTPTLLAPSSWKLPGSHSTSTSALHTSAPFIDLTADKMTAHRIVRVIMRVMRRSLDVSCPRRKERQLVRDLAGGHRHELTENMRSDPGIFNFVKWLRVGEEACPTLEQAKARLRELFPSKPGWPDTTLVISHSKRMAVNAAANRALAPEASELEVMGCYETVTPQNSPQSMRVWPGLRLIGAGGKIPKGVFVAVAEVEPDGVRLDNGMRLKNQELLRATRPSHAVTYASCQGLTLHNRVRLDLESCHLTLRHLYVGASRATSSELLEA